MCGIVGYAGDPVSLKEDFTKRLWRLERRGYDSAGIVTSDGFLRKTSGKILNLYTSIGEDRDVRIAIGHTRWATHGGATDTNSHPHFNSEKNIYVVHNGIITNFQEMRSDLQAKGYNFISETDTEVVPHYFDYHQRNGAKTAQVIQRFFSEAQGTYAILLMFPWSKEIFALKKDSPLLLGLSDDGSHVLASDVCALTGNISRAIEFNDYEYAVISPGEYTFYNQHGNQIDKETVEFEGIEEIPLSDEFPHHMLQEIKEQPKAALRAIDSMKEKQNEKIEKVAGMIREANKIVFLACGTSHNAGSVVGRILAREGYNIHNTIGSDFEPYGMDQNTLIIAISQSGETMEVITPMKAAKEKGAKVVSLVNTQFSVIEKLSDVSLHTMAGPEIAVASTKAFTNQVIMLLGVAQKLGVHVNLESIPGNISAAIDQNEHLAKKHARLLQDKSSLFVIGRGILYPVAVECALKIKEVTYIHAEGMIAGELKHGTISLVEDGTPVVCLSPNNDANITSRTQEVQARGANTIIVSNSTDGSFFIPASEEAEFAICSTIVGQLLSYYIGVEKGCDIDQPKNLAKCVTVC